MPIAVIGTVACGVVGFYGEPRQALTVKSGEVHAPIFVALHHELTIRKNND